MSRAPGVPVELQIRRIIFEKFNDVEARFTNDEIFQIMQESGGVDPAWKIDDVEPFFEEICRSGMARNIAQNFTTVWLKLFSPVRRIHCGSCDTDVHLGESEEQTCPNPACRCAL
ncbi:MAG: hypothetical protein EB830_06130 [Nitrosopumilus sp. H13]|nr:MAG: hypothetical protein EB830_06130 [Nitrosopumilus sp. H13]